MISDDIRKAVLDALGSVAPEADLGRLRPDKNLREQLDIDSMDFLNFMLAIHRSLEIEIPEADYGQLVTLDGCIQYLNQRVPQNKANG